MPSVKDLMTKDVIMIDLNETVRNASILMNDKGRACVVVIDEETPIGIVTERDFVRRVIARGLPLDTKISEIMSKPLITIDSNSSIRNAARLMIKNKIRRLVVMEHNKVIGILATNDFARHLSKKSITEEILEAMARYPPYTLEY